MRTRTHRLLAIVFLFFGLFAHAQSEAEKTLLKSASKQFESHEFLEALPSYSQLLSIAPDNKDYNFKYGVCLLASDEDVERSLKHLKYACADGNFEDKRAFYYLGKAYHLNYQFADALRSYNDFKDKVDPRTLNGFREVDRLITMAENGKELMSDIKDIKVIDKTESTAGDFFRNYDMDVMGGSVIKVPEKLLSSADKKNGHSPIMFFPEGGGEIIFSSYGNESHLELYSVERTSDGGFSKPEKLPGVVNSPFDEDYPFLHSDGRTLYFSSKGHNSMGGYDIFKSKRDLSTGIFDTPVNLDFAISSPDDDIFYMVDREKRIANFASDRSSETGRLHVYKVAVSSAAVEMAIIQGKLVNNTGGNSIAQIKVLDANTDEEIGVYLTDEEGNYIIDLPGTGKYKFFVEAEESNVLHTGLVDVPSFGKIKAFKQEMVLSEESAQEKLVIRNQFDQEADIDVMALIQEVVKQRAELDVNFEGQPEPEVEEVEEVQQLTESELVSRAGFGEDVSIASVVEMGQQQSGLIASRVTAETIERDKAYARAIDWTEQSEVLMAEAERLYRDSQSASSSEEKEEILLMTSIKRAEAERAAHEAAIALVLAEEIDEVVDEKVTVLKALEERNEKITVSIESNDQETLITHLEDVKSYGDKAEVQADALDAINQRSIESTREARKIISRVEEIRSSKDAAVGSIKTKETQLAKAKKQKDKDILEAELSSLKAEVEDIDQQLERASSRLVTSQIDADDSEAAVKLLEQIRVGQMEDLVALQPLPIPEGGIATAQLRVGNIRTKGEQIEISKEELGRIMQTRPELLSSLSNSEKQILAEISKYDLASDAESASIDSQDNTELVEVDSIEDAIEEAVSGEEPAENVDIETTGVVDEQDAITQEEELPRIESAEPDYSEETLTDNLEEEIPRSADELIDYSELNSTQLLFRLQTDYQSALDEIERSDMIEIEKAKANIDLNRAAVQVIDEKIQTLENSSDFSSNEIKQGNVQALDDLADELVAEMLIIAAQTETSLAPREDNTANVNQEEDETIKETTQVDSQDESVNEDEAQILPRGGESNSTSLASQLEKSDELLDMEAEIVAIQAEEDMSQLVRTAAKIKSRSEFIEGLKTTALVDSTLNEEERSALVSLIQIQQKNLEGDVRLWQVDTGTFLTPAQMILAKNDIDYITKLTLLQTSFDTRPIEVLDYEVSRKVMEDIDYLMLLGVDFTSQEEKRELQEYIASTSEDELTQSYETLYSELAPVAENEDWIEGLISDKGTRQRIKIIRQEMSTLPVYGSSDEDKIQQHITLNADLASPLNEEIQWKEEELAFAAKRNPFPAEVSKLVEEAYVLNKRADVIRDNAQLSTDQARNAEMFTNATLLDLAGLDRLEKAQQLEKHLSKGKDRGKFEYREAVVIDSGLLMNETESFASQSKILEEEPLGSLIDSEENTSQIIDEQEPLTQVNDSITPTSYDDETDNTALETEDLSSESTEDRVLTGGDQPQDPSDEIVDYGSFYDRESIDASEAIQTYPEITSELTESDILPILSFEDEISLMSEQDLEPDYPGDWNETNATPEQLLALEIKGVELDKHERYRSELEETVVYYDTERKKRSVRLAEVIDQMNTTGATNDLEVEAERLATEIQIIDSYSRKANENIDATQVKLTSLKEEQQAIVLEIDDTASLVETDALAEQDFEIVPESTVEDNTEVITDVSENNSDLIEESVVLTPAPDYYAFVVPEVLTSDLFRLSAPDESRNRSISIDGKMPAGTVYQVQVGAFRNPIPEAHFSEFDPIMGTLLDNGITRYKVGLFQNESTAIIARDQIRSIGYSDAFVVKYIDGTRDGIVNTPAIATTTTNDIDSGTSSTSTVQSSVSETDARASRPLSSYDSDNTAYYEEAINAAPATQVERIEGLFYTVQVGVYSKPVTLASIFGISPLNSDLTSSGYIRYTSGIFDDLLVADQWKEKIRERGVQDAFVTAYYNGNRITIEQASQILSYQGRGVLVEIQELNSLDSDRQGQAIWEMVSTSDLFSDEVEDQIDFKIRMGPYYERIPDKDVKVILDFEENVEYSQLSDGAIIYTTKGRMNYEQSQEWRARFLELGISNANIIALRNGEEVPLKQALDFLLK